ncbi:hypothetical protein GCM10023093_30560 [Nemorincola caseinilytica]|uniref:Uncharacterized protein n=1 Tax=Nemorincola caseinilytica TaxID=2054315 RepID=A0ABP8NSF5_9BACT
MRNICITVAVILYLCGCDGPGGPSSGNSGHADTIGTSRTAEISTIPIDVLQEIKDHYQKEYGSKARLEEENSDTLLEMTYYAIPTKEDRYDGYLIAISIPKKPQEFCGASALLHGDLNNDGTADLAISVHTEGGGGGGNMASQDIFLYENIGGHYQLNSVTSDGDICGCDEYGGYFRATGIENGLLTGTSSCYTKDDPRCCASLAYDTKVRLDGNKLILHSKDNERRTEY